MIKEAIGVADTVEAAKEKAMAELNVSFDDDLMRRFGTEKIQNMLVSIGFGDDQAIRSKTFTKSIETAQKKVEDHLMNIKSIHIIFG